MRIVTFRVGDQLYGIDIMYLKEVLEPREVRSISNSPVYVEGIINLEGEIVPIINIHRRFGIAPNGSEEADEQLSGFLVIEVNPTTIGVRVDRISKVISVDPADMRVPGNTVNGIGNEYIRGTFEDMNLQLLDVQRLFDPDELKKIMTMSK